MRDCLVPRKKGIMDRFNTWSLEFEQNRNKRVTNGNMNPQRHWDLSHEQPKSPNATIATNGLIRDLPSTMLNDQFGVAGFVVGQKVGFGRQLPDNIAKDVITEMSQEFVQKSMTGSCPWLMNFSGPLLKPVEPSFFSVESKVPCPAYLVTSRKFAENSSVDVDTIRKSLSLKTNKFADDLLFFIFYSFPQDILQLVAAERLYVNGWRYHMEAKVWIHRITDADYSKEVNRKGISIEKGIYNYFNCKDWKIEQIECVLDFNKLEGPPEAPKEGIFVPNAKTNQC